MKIGLTTSYNYVDGAHFTEMTGSRNPFHGQDPPGNLVITDGTVNIGVVPTGWKETKPECFDMDGDGDYDCVVSSKVTLASSLFSDT